MGRSLAKLFVILALACGAAAGGEEPVRLVGHRNIVFAVSVSPDGKTIATGSEDNTVRLWDRPSGKQVRCLTLHTARLCAVAFSPDGKLLASSGQDGFVRLIDVVTGKERRRMRGHTTFARSIAFTPDGKLIASGGDDGVILVRDVATSREKWRLTGHRRSEHYNPAVWSMAFSPDGEALVSASSDGTVRLWDLNTGKERRVLSRKRDVRSVAFSPDGSTVAGASQLDDAVHLWETATGKERCPPLAQPAPLAVAFAPDDMFLAAGGADRTVRLWSLPTGKEFLTLRGHTQAVHTLAFAADGRALVSGGYDLTPRVWGIGELRFRQAAKLGTADGERLWADLGGVDAVKAYRAVWRLRASADAAVAFLEPRLRLSIVAHVSATYLIKDLDDRRFAVRTKALRELEKQGRFAESALRAALADKPSLEMRRRIEPLLARMGPAGHMPVEDVRSLRALEVLEYVGSPAARRLLTELSRGKPSLLSHAAKGSLERLVRTRRPR